MDTQKERIFFVEDNEQLVALACKKLENEGYEVAFATNGNEALEKIQILLPDLIILDINIPGINGFEVKTALNAQELTKNIPVIFLSGKGTIEDRVKGLELGADDYIAKPFLKEELFARIKVLLRRKKYFEYIALHDNLTGLYNHSYFHKQFTQFFHIAERYGNAFSLIFIDINKFKFINDTYGHKAGDKALQTVAELLKNKLRKSDILSRYGGDEFAVILPYTGKDKADELAKRLVEMVAATPVSLDTTTEIRLSISFGIAEYSKEYKTPDEMFDDADKKMYHYKKQTASAQNESSDSEQK